MPVAAGPILRILGLVIELLGLALLALSGRNDGADLGARLGIAVNTVWAIVLVGFVVWATGTALILANRKTPNREADSERRHEPS